MEMISLRMNNNEIQNMLIPIITAHISSVFVRSGVPQTGHWLFWRPSPSMRAHSKPTNTPHEGQKPALTVDHSPLVVTSLAFPQEAHAGLNRPGPFAGRPTLILGEFAIFADMALLG
jgi:hypothetical protein